MADEDDIKHALEGNRDLVRCVLEGADLNGRSFQFCDFRYANIKKTKFQKCDLSSCNFSDAETAHSDFSHAVLDGSKFTGSLFGIRFNNASLKGVSFKGLFHRCDFTNANLTDADFSGSRIGEGCNFSGALVGPKTNFHGVGALRPYSKLPIFKNYHYERGVFHRLGTESSDDNMRTLSLHAIDALDIAIRQIRMHQDKNDRTSMIGHNNPPDEFTISDSDCAEDIKHLEETNDNISTRSVRPDMLKVSVQILSKYLTTSLRWIAYKADAFADEFVKKAGATLASKTMLVSAALYFSDAMTGAIQAIQKLLSSLPI